MNTKSADKVKLLSLILVGGLVTSMSIVFAKVVFDRGQTVEAGISLLVGLALFSALLMFVVRKYKELEKGEPMVDERTRELVEKAGYRAFLMSLYWLLAIGWTVDNIESIDFDVSAATGLGILGMSILFGLNYLYLNIKGDPSEK